jgi:hypothetical protein
MKKTIILIFCTLITTAALCQNPLAEVEIIRLWNSRKDVPATPGTSYQWNIPGDTAYYFQPTKGKIIQATITFKEVGNQPPPLTLKETQDNTQAIYKLADGTVVNPGTNVYNVNSWNSFNGLVAPSPKWVLVFENKTCSFSYVVNSTATFTFTGKRFELLGERTDNKGIVGIKVDNGAESLVDLYAATGVNNSQIIFFADVPQGTHTITVRITGNKNPASSNTNLLIDALRIFE